LLSSIGGFFGLLCTFIITEIGKRVMDMDISLSGTNIILGFTISVLIGIISGFIPAYSASQLDPVEAIRTN
jgi:putative ABC transport system permease protein